MNNKNDKSRINVDRLFYEHDIISIDEWHNDWQVCPIQRDHDERSRKPKHRNKFKQLESAHLEVDGAILTEDCYDPETKKTYKAGTKFKTDAHTRDAYWWSDYSDFIPEKVRVKYKGHSHMSTIYSEYLMRDNPDDAEIASDRVDGAYRAIYAERGISIKDGKLRKVEPIQHAALQCFPNKYSTKMKTNTVNIKMWVSDLDDAILWLRDIFANPKFGYRNQTKLSHVNPFTWAYLVSYMKYKDSEESLKKLEELIIRVSNYNEVVVKSKTENGEHEVDHYNPLNRLMEEWSQLKAATSLYVQTAAMNGSVQSDNMRSFTLICIDHFIEGIYFTKSGKMTPTWKTYLNDWNLAYKVAHGMVTTTETNDFGTLPLNFLVEDEEEDDDDEV